jgi:hypothetical protein
MRLSCDISHQKNEEHWDHRATYLKDVHLLSLFREAGQIELEIRPDVSFLGKHPFAFHP